MSIILSKCILYTHTQNNAALTGRGDFDIGLQDLEDRNQEFWNILHESILRM